MQKSLLTLVFFSLFVSAVIAQPRFRALVLFENGGHHLAFTNRAQPWLNQLAADSNFIIQYIQSTDSINEAFLSRFSVFIQLDYPPYGWTADAVVAFKDYIEQGKGGWVGFITPPCWANDGYRCGHGSPVSWEESIQTTSDFAAAR
jgi:hypothetical protein